MRPSFIILSSLLLNLSPTAVAASIPAIARAPTLDNDTSLVDLPSSAALTLLASLAENETLSDEDRNPYVVHPDQIPILNETKYSAPNISFLDLVETTTKRKRQDPGNVALRIMPLGASITQGLNTVEHPDASTDIGYRLSLRQFLRNRAYEVNYIGSKKNGNFADNENEGHPGLQIHAVHEVMNPVLSNQKPNLILLNAGTNDCVQADDSTLTPVDTGITWVTKIPDRIRSMLNDIYDQSEGVTVILSTLLPNFTPGTAGGYITLANQGIRNLYNEQYALGRRIILADMDMDGYWNQATDYSDVTHPNDAGYKKMAGIWAAAFLEVEKASFLVAPIDTGLGGDDSSGECMPSSGSFASAVTSVDFDWGANDGTYSHSSTLKMTETWSVGPFNKSLLSYNQFHFAQLVSLEDTDLLAQDELIVILDPEQRAYNSKKSSKALPKAYFQYRYNYGNSELDEHWTDVDIVGQGTPECLSRGVRFGDVNGDGLDDFICVNSEGSPFVSLNRGGSPPTFEYIGQIYSDRFTQAQTRLADIDGDGRLDYCGMDVSGDAWCHRNGGTGDAPTAKYKGYWQGMLLGAGGPTWDSLQTDVAGVRFLDINGDGRADYVFVNDDGSTMIYINQRGDRNDGPGLKPHWVQALVSHKGFPDDETMSRNRILFGRVYGSGRQDYIQIIESKSGKEYSYKFSVWQNTGSGGTKLNGDGVRFCDLDGDGLDDLVNIWGGGMVDAQQRVDNGDGSFSWTDWGRIAELAIDRKFVHLADWDGDGRCDLLTVDKSTGDVVLHKNYLLTKQFTNGDGSYRDYSPHIAAGTSVVNYLCMDPDGRTVGWLNQKSGLSALNQIKVSVGFDRQNHRWADVDGDGKVDFIWVDKHTGNVQFWINNGFVPSIGSSMNWVGYSSSWMTGQDRGDNVLFPSMVKDSKRADYYIVHPRTGRGTTYLNDCSGDGGVGPGPDEGAGPTDPGFSIPTLPDPNGGSYTGNSSCVYDKRSLGRRATCIPPDAAVIAAASSKFPGVDWVTTAKTCNEPAFSDLVDTHAKAIEMMELTPDLKSAWETPGFNRYFVASTLWQETDAWDAQSGKYAAVLDWAKRDPGVPITPQKQTTYYCGNPSWAKPRDHCSQYTGALTFTPTYNPDCKNCNQIALCPKYFDTKRVDEITATKQRVENLPYGQQWASREHLLIHEWFHNYMNDAVPSARWHIKDVQDTIDGQKLPIYGAGRAAHYAWQGVGSGSVLDGTIMEKTMENADSFAWMISYNWYDDVWVWADDGRWRGTTTKREMDEDALGVRREGLWERSVKKLTDWLLH
ncbi:hypothetical protein SLS60_000570 [Paraconiothyrium brasiliense]|uniref:SGNH hydrolase-type esterase domain-containing protein n=1 Tax=Paraconiothyrium brasiliense TaxID=300254 RepID=A0ABR3S7R9_9PLEO